jgi:uncharacterized protein (DUF58 family)
MLNFYKKIFVNRLFFYLLGSIIVCFVVSFFWTFLYEACWLLFYILLFFTLIDLFLLFIVKSNITAKRETPEKLSNGDENEIKLKISNQYSFKIEALIIDEIPFQFQKRDFQIIKNIESNQKTNINYFLKPSQRGEYVFGNLNIYVSSPLKLISRKYVFDNNQMVPTYPSFIQLRKYDLMAFSNKMFMYGLKKIRRIGHTMEFEQIKEYVLGDDIRTINWKATAKKNALMVNQFQDEKSQAVYLIIDKGRVMKMPFNGLSLLDYSINSTLALANIILKKSDKVGMFTFSKKVENRIVAEKKASQLSLFLENLYNVKTNYFESDFSQLYVNVKNNINQRSLIILYTNFETLDSLKRQLPYLVGIAKNHLLAVVFFKNTELHEITEKKSENIQDIYDKVIAEKFNFEKRLIVNELKKHGIHALLTSPESLTVDSINQYLEIKSRGIL